MTGREKAKVLPLPVGAEQQISLGGRPNLLIKEFGITEERISGITCHCT